MTNRVIKETYFQDGFRISEIEETYTYIDDLREYGRFNIEYSNILERIEKGENHEFIMAEKVRVEEMLTIYEDFMARWKNEMGKRNG